MSGVLPPLLELREVNRSFGAIAVARDINLSVMKGEALGIIGPNGAGKSTLFNLISGDLRPQSGSVLIGGTDVTAWSTRRRALHGIGRTYQIPLPFGEMTVHENLMVAGAFAGGLGLHEASAAARDILRLLALDHRADEAAGSLRLLDRKRLELGRALATRPSLLLLDEIAGGLSDRECDSLIDCIRSILDRGTTVIWIEHVLHALVEVVGRVMVLNQGAMIMDGEPARVMQSPAVREIYLGLDPLELAP
nr:ABC transporter ATP-binding protein [uncultured Gellertiella sp.]